MERELKPGQMDHSLKENTWKERRAGGASTSGQMGLSMTESGRIMKYRGLGTIAGLMEEST